MTAKKAKPRKPPTHYDDGLYKMASVRDDGVALLSMCQLMPKQARKMAAWLIRYANWREARDA